MSYPARVEGVVNMKKILYILEADILTIKKNLDLKSLAQMMYFLQDVFQMSAIALVSVINHYHINGLHLFWDIQYNWKKNSTDRHFAIINLFWRATFRQPVSSDSGIKMDREIQSNLQIILVTSLIKYPGLYQFWEGI